MLFCVMLSFMILQAAEVYLSACICEGLCAGGLAAQRELRVQSVVNEERFVCACECTCLGWVLWGRGGKKKKKFDLIYHPPRLTEVRRKTHAHAHAPAPAHTQNVQALVLFPAPLLFCPPVCV